MMMSAGSEERKTQFEKVCASHVLKLMDVYTDPKHTTHTHMEIFSAWSMGETLVFNHVVFSLRWKAERLRKQWEEEEEERLKQTPAPAKPKGKMTSTA